MRACEKIAPVRVHPVLVHPEEKRGTLGDEWEFRLDPGDEGVQAGWFKEDHGFHDVIRVPGCWQGQGFGGEGTDTLYDFRYEARVFQATYTGTGWYRKRFALPGDFSGKRIRLNFGGVHPSAEVWLNGVRLGEHGAPFVPFGFEITEHVRGKENLLAVRVHEQDRDIGFSFNWQGNWSGLYRAVELSATGPCSIERLWLYPDAESSRLRVKARVGGLEGVPGRVTLALAVSRAGGDPVVSRELRVERSDVEIDLRVPDAVLWGPGSPALYRVDAVLFCDGEVSDAQSERTGFVNLTADGKRIRINGEPSYMRGSGDHALCTWTGTEQGADRDGWRRKLRVLRDYGYNYVRCVSIAPTPEYFDAADEVGLFVQGDMGMLGGWSGHSPWHVYNWPYPMPDRREKIKWQWDRVVMRDVNHPSANLYSMSNELYDQLHFPRIARQCYRDTKDIKPTALVIYTDGGFLEGAPQDFACDDVREGRDPGIPIIMHEFRWWSSYPDVRIMHKYKGSIRPYAAERAIEAAARHGIAHVLPQAAANSQRLQFIEAKTKMEICRRDNGMHGYEHTGKARLPEADSFELAGICHFNAMDTNPSPQGIVDEFYEPKYATAELWRQTNGDCVVLSSLGFDDRVAAGGDTVRCSFYVSDFSHPPLKQPLLSWRLAAGDREIVAGRLEFGHTPYCTHPIGGIEIAVPRVGLPVRACLEARLTDGNRTVTNQWDFWLFPSEAALPESVCLYGEPAYTWLKATRVLPSVDAQALAGGNIKVVLTERLDHTLVRFLHGGGRVVLAASEGLVRPFAPKFGYSFGRYFNTPPANYGPYEDGHDGTIIASHPILGDFPHEGFADLQFFRMIANAPPVQLEPFGLNGVDPIIRVMHSYPVARSLGYLCEAAVGAGGLVICALDLDQALPEARFLLAQMCGHVAAPDFAPSLALHDRSLAKIVRETALP